jgi:hypothetical protein
MREGIFMNTEELRALVRKKWASPAWALFEEVGNGTGSNCGRHADAIAFSVWPSRGLELHGIEIKASRSDWLRELKKPEKADAFQEYCDFWFVVVGDEKIALPEEVPANWGLLLAKGNRFLVRKQAPRLTPKPLDRVFFASLMRKAFEAQEEIRRTADAQGFERGVAKGPEEHQRKLNAVERDKTALQNMIADFEAASGCSLSGWTAGEVGKAVKIVTKSFLNVDFDYQINRLKAQVLGMVQDIDQCLKVASEVRGATGK